MRKRWAVAIIGLGIAGSVDARATYSITAVDTRTKDVGGAGTSCVGEFSVSNIYGSVPGRGVVHAQALLNFDGRDQAVDGISEGQSAADIMNALTTPRFDPQASLRQYGVVLASGDALAFTGTDTGPFAGHLTRTTDGFSYTVQGNILTGRTVLEQATNAFEGGGCDLADRLMLALEAGANNGQGDARCTPTGIPSDGAFIRVDRPNEPRWLFLSVDNTAPDNPLVGLRQRYDAWRNMHPCPVVVLDDGETASNDKGRCGCRQVNQEVEQSKTVALWGLLGIGMVVLRRGRSAC